MKVIAFNGSPRKDWNTATLLRHALEGSASKGAETELIHLYDINYKGCISCFACKQIGGKSYGRCAVADELRPILKKVEEANAIILGSPIYLGSVTGEMRSFMERLIYPYLVYDENGSTLFNKKLTTAFIYSMGANEDRMKIMGYDKHSVINEMLMNRIFGGKSESLFVNDTYQFDDYSKYVSTSFNPKEKAEKKETGFPKDCNKAFELGANLLLDLV